MGKKLLTTPRSRVKNALRQLFLRSRERASAIRRDGYTCQRCGVKQSRKKGAEVFIECHHLGGIGDWQRVIDLVYEEILCSPDRLETLCKTCHQTAEVHATAQRLL